MKNWYNESTDALCDAILSLKNREECYAFLEDICTIKEVQDMAQRLFVAKLLAEKISYNEISEKTGASTATISRVSKCFTYGDGGYKTVIDRLNEDESSSEK